MSAKGAAECTTESAANQEKHADSRVCCQTREAPDSRIPCNFYTKLLEAFFQIKHSNQHKYLYHHND